MEKKKQSYSYTTYPDIIKVAKVVAATEGTTVSEKIHEFLKTYVTAKGKTKFK